MLGEHVDGHDHEGCEGAHRAGGSEARGLGAYSCMFNSKGPKAGVPYRGIEATQPLALRRRIVVRRSE